MIRFTAAAVFLLSTAAYSVAQAPASDSRVATAVRSEQPIRIDGVFDEEAWSRAEMLGQFVQQEPDEGRAATEKTEVRIIYDSRRIVIGVLAHDSQPSGVIATEMRRDSNRILDEDNFQVIIDTFRDYRNGYMFVTSPLGAKLEQQISDEGEGDRRGNNSNVNRNWDGIWDVAARRTDFGWVAEIEIPTTTLQFSGDRVQNWGINFERSIRRKNEQVFWSPIPKAYSLTRVSLAGSLEGLEGLSQGLDLKVKPFFISGLRQRRGTLGDRDTFERDGGLDLKYGVTSGLTLDVTVNTDFAQVEVDEQQVNLTRFSLFYPEKRDFFLENAGMFLVGTQRQEADLFFSRSIGLSETGQPIPIIAGGRLTGKVGAHSIAVVDIQTDDVLGKPGHNFLVSRYSRDILARSKVGGLFINKRATDGSSYNRTMAMDGTFALRQSWLINGYIAKTQSPHLAGRDMAYYSRVAYRNQAWNLYGQFVDIQDNFNAEVGFVPRKGIRTTTLHFNPTPRPRKFGIRMMDPMLNFIYTTDQKNRLLSRRLHHMVAFTFDDGTYLNFILNKNFEHLDQPFQIRRGIVIPVGTYRFNEAIIQLNSNPARKIYQRLQWSPQSFYGGDRTDWDAAVGFRATSQLAFEAQYRRNDVRLKQGEFEVNLGTLRVDYALSPRMTLRTLTQYNSSTRELNNSIRFNYIYKPGSDLYIVYNDLNIDLPNVPTNRDRQFVVKLSYLLSR